MLYNFYFLRNLFIFGTEFTGTEFIGTKFTGTEFTGHRWKLRVYFNA